MSTMQDVVNLARSPLNDDGDGVDANRRYPDAILLRYAVSGLMDLLLHRSDLFIGQFLAPPSFASYTLATAFPIDESYMQALADWCTYRAEMMDDENVDGGRAMSFSTFYGRMSGR